MVLHDSWKYFIFIGSSLKVTRLVKYGTGKTTLAIGDGANDVGMLQEADVGIGISDVSRSWLESICSVFNLHALSENIMVHQLLS